MKNISKELIALFLVTVFFSCKEEKTLVWLREEPPIVQIEEPPVVLQPETKIDTVAYATKEPFVEIKDRGLEAYLILNGFDLDNQINGKIATMNLDTISRLELTYFKENFSQETEKKMNFLIRKYSLETINGYNQYTGFNKTLIIKNVNDLKNFKNLRFLGALNLTMDSLIIDFENNLVEVVVPEKATLLNLNSCKNLNYLSLGNLKTKLNADLRKLTNLRSLKILGDISNIDFSTNSNLTDLSIENTSLNQLDLSGFPALYRLVISRVNQLKKIYLPKSIGLLSVDNTVLENIEAPMCERMQVLKINNNRFLTKINVSNSSKIYSSITKDNPLLTEILLNSNTIIDSTAYHPHASGAPNIKLWQKDPWTNWVVKK